MAADSPLFRAFGPGLAITVLVGLAVSVTMVPALLAILGHRAFWPSRPGAAAARPRSRAVVTGGFLRLIGRRPVAAAVTAVIGAGLIAATVPLGGLRAAVSPIAALPGPGGHRPPRRGSPPASWAWSK